MPEALSLLKALNHFGSEKKLEMKFTFPTKLTYFNSENISPVDTFKKLKEVANFFGKIIGAGILCDNFSLKTPLFCILVVNLLTYLGINFQNIYVNRKNFELLVFCVVTLGMGFQGVIKLYTFVWHRTKMLKLFDLAESFYKSSSDEKFQQIIEKWVLLSCHVGFFIVTLFTVSAIVILVYPLIVYSIIGVRVHHFGFLIPGINAESWFGYCLNFVHHSFQTYCVISSLIATCVSLLKR